MSSSTKCGAICKNGKKCKNKTNGGKCNLHALKTPGKRSVSPRSPVEDIIGDSPRIYSPTKLAFLGMTPPSSPKRGSPSYAMPDYIHQKNRKDRINTGFTPPALEEGSGYFIGSLVSKSPTSKSPKRSPRNSTNLGYPGGYQN